MEKVGMKQIEKLKINILEGWDIGILGSLAYPVFSILDFIVPTCQFSSIPITRSDNMKLIGNTQYTYKKQLY